MDAFEFTVYLLVAADMADEFGATLTAVNGVVTADRWGRRPVLMASILMMALCDGAIAFAPSLAWVLGLRVLFGFAMGAEWTAGATMAMENWPARSRGIASGVLQGSWAVGYFLAAIVPRWVVPLWGWRVVPAGGGPGAAGDSRSLPGQGGAARGRWRGGAPILLAGPRAAGSAAARGLGHPRARLLLAPLPEPARAGRVYARSQPVLEAP